MTYTRLTLTEFQAVFTEFGDVTEAQYDFWATRAEAVIDSAYGGSQAYATQLLTAHYLTINGLSSSTQGRRFSQFGGATSIKSGDLQLGWAADTSGSLVSTFQDTSYGRQCLAMARAFKGGPRLTSTGTVCQRFPYGLA